MNKVPVFAMTVLALALLACGKPPFEQHLQQYGFSCADVEASTPKVRGRTPDHEAKKEYVCEHKDAAGLESVYIYYYEDAETAHRHAVANVSENVGSTKHQTLQSEGKKFFVSISGAPDGASVKAARQAWEEYNK